MREAPVSDDRDKCGVSFLLWLPVVALIVGGLVVGTAYLLFEGEPLPYIGQLLV
jgi:hypothetical protein